MTRNAIILAGLALVAAPALAQSPSVQSLTDGGRYALLELNDQVVRLDTETGTFTLCSMEAGAWACAMTTDERQLYEERLQALSKRIELLETAQRAAPLAVTGSVNPVPVQPVPAPEAGANAPTPLPDLVTKPAGTLPDTITGPVANAQQPLAPAAAPETPTMAEGFATPQESKPERKGFFRRLAGALPFVD